jgi:phosphoglycolate phosphatase
MYKAIVFDLDGTLLDTLQDIAESMNRALARLAFPPHALDAYRYFVGDGMEALCRRALPASHNDEKTVAQALLFTREEYAQHCNDNTRMYAGIPELLDALTRRRARLSVCSNKPHDFTRQCVTQYLSRWRFDPVLGSRPNIPNKPDPTGALEIVRLLGLTPQEFLYLGDTAIDMKTATAAGMFPVGVTWGFRTAEELTQNGAKLLINHPMELMKLFES